jgi:hypothetical protein
MKDLEKLYNLVSNEVKKILDSKNILVNSEKTLMESVPLVIECVESLTNEELSGQEKKDLAIRVILFIVDSCDIDDDKKNLLRHLVEDGLLDITIDIIVDASKGTFEINRKTRIKGMKLLTKLFKSLFESCKRKNSTNVKECDKAGAGCDKAEAETETEAETDKAEAETDKAEAEKKDDNSNPLVATLVV